MNRRTRPSLVSPAEVEELLPKDKAAAELRVAIIGHKRVPDLERRLAQLERAFSDLFRSVFALTDNCVLMAQTPSAEEVLAVLYKWSRDWRPMIEAEGKQ